MSLIRVHNFAIPLDGFDTDDGLALEAPFGYAGERFDVEIVTLQSGVAHTTFTRR